MYGNNNWSVQCSKFFCVFIEFDVLILLMPHLLCMRDMFSMNATCCIYVEVSVVLIVVWEIP